MVTEDQLAAKVHEFLQNSDLKKTTNNILIKKLEDDFGVDLSDKKPFLRYQVGRFLQSQYEVSEEDDDGVEVNREDDDFDDDDENDDVSDDDDSSGGNDDDELFDKVTEVRNVVKISNNGDCKLKDCHNLERPIRQSDKYGDVRLGGLSVPEVSAVVKINNNGNCKLKGTDKLERRPRKNREKIKRTCFSGKYCILSPKLQKFLGVPHMTRTEVVKQLWTYVKEKSLQDPNDGKTIFCDETLRDLLGVDSITILQINKALTKHITPSEKSRTWDKLRKQDKEEEMMLLPKDKAQKHEREKDPCGDESNEKRQKQVASVFFPPLPLSDTLKRFLGTGETALTRADVIKRVWDYIKQKNLKDPSDKKTIICDEKLKELVNVDTFHGFTVTKLLSPHFVKM